MLDGLSNAVRPPSARPISLVHVLRDRAERRSDQRAYVFLDYGAGDECAETTVTYAELDQRARAVAALLQGATQPGDRALLLYPAGLDYLSAFLGCLYAGVAAVPAYPPEYARLSRRMESVVADCAPSVVLSTARVRQQSQPLRERLAGGAGGGVRWFSTDEGLAGAEHLWKEPALDPSGLAFLQYTSGSSGDPKGVMVTHGNLVANLHGGGLSYAPSDLSVMWVPPYHDMGLIAVLLQALYTGFPCVAMSPFAFIQSPWRWLHQASRRRATVIGAPNFAFDLCVRKIPKERRSELDLSALRFVWSGAEPVRADTMDRFRQAFAPCGLRPEALSAAYGMAESTVLVSMSDRALPPRVLEVDEDAYARGEIAPPASPARARRAVGCGAALPDHQVLVVDPEARVPCAERQIGELWLAGPSIATGYWGRPEQSEHTFAATLATTAGAPPGASRGPYLRTGDLGFLEGGQIYIAGRLKDLIIIRGVNHYPQDIELTVERSHPALRPGCGAAFSVDEGGEERLVVVQEVRSVDRGAEEVFAAIRAAVREQHEILVHEIVLVEANGIVKTTSGKIARKPCRAALQRGELPVWKRWRGGPAEGPPPRGLATPASV